MRSMTSDIKRQLEMSKEQVDHPEGLNKRLRYEYEYYSSRLWSYVTC